ncbi:VWA-like domain-containing protein [uncultured Thiocystis sp.]|jgi:predicted metal-dependent peptidase|uniref:vWA domain-containing protein n=1 Tax=uncultured Thiocystis sp. TaxID=1202134 RepID=UPI0025E5452C|nr:VWA-like domain-containing protein [uncultured Thiocystis sp.]
MDARPPGTTGAGGLYCHRGTRAIQTLVEFAPSSGGLALWMRHLDVDHAEAPDIAANDGATVFYGPAFASLPGAMQTGLVAHQVLHVALRHPQRLLELRRLVGDVDDELYNVCADAIVNSSLSHLSWLDLPPGSVLLEDLLFATLNIRQSVEKSLLEWDLERLYRALDDRRPHGASRGSKAGAGSERESPATSAGAGDQDAEQGQTTACEDGERAARARALGATIIRDLLPAAESERPEVEVERSREWRERIVRAHAGDGVHSLLRELLADLPKTRIPWEQLLRTQLAHGLSLKRELSWSRPSRSYLANRGRMGRGRSGGGLRMPWEPGFSATRAVARLVVMVDVSGSIDHPLLERFAGEIDAIARRLEARVIVIIGDDRVTDTRVFEPGRSNLKGLRFEGGGGTDFTPLLREAERYSPDIGVFLTDLDGRADFCPGFPLLWAVPLACQSMRPPFGRKLVLD